MQIYKEKPPQWYQFLLAVIRFPLSFPLTHIPFLSEAPKTFCHFLVVLFIYLFWTDG